MVSRREMDVFQRRLTALSENTWRAIQGTYTNLNSAGYRTEEIVDVLSPLVLRASVEGASIGTSHLAQQLLDKGIDPVNALPDASFSYEIRIDPINKATRTIMSEEVAEFREMKLERFSRNAPIESGQRAYNTAMQGSSNVAGYVRVLDSEACELCVWLYRDGYVYPPNRPLTTHPGCVCTAEPLTPQELKDMADMRYASPVRGGTSRSAKEYTQRERNLWHMRADYAAANGTSPDEWGQPPSDGRRQAAEMRTAENE